MADEHTGADSVRWYGSGAASDGAAQTNPNLNLGKYRSATEVTSLGIATSGGPSNVTVGFASGANGTGAGSISAESVDSLAWTPPGGTKGTAVTIANGETKVLVAGGSAPAKYARVTRTSTDDLTGTMTVTLTDQFNNPAGMDNVTTAEQAAGDMEYRCIVAKNGASSGINGLDVWLKVQGTANTVNAAGYAAAGAVTVTITSGNIDDWPASGFFENDTTHEVLYYSERSSSVLTVPAAGRDVWSDALAAGVSGHAITPIAGLRIAKEAPTSQATGSFTDKTGAGEDSQPAGLTWCHGHASDDADRVEIGDLAASYIYGLWIERAVAAGATAEASVLNAAELTFEAL